MTGSEAARQVRAVLGIQWLSMKNSLRRRNERVGLVVSAVVAFFWYGLWTAAAVGLAVFPLWASTERLERILPAVLVFVILYWQITPLLSASMGVSIDLRKMALYPIDVKTLFLVECLLRLMTGLEMVLLLSGLTVGMTARAPRQAVVFLPAVLLFVLFNILLSAGLRNLLERLLQRRRFREIFVFVVVMASVTPQLILWSGSGSRVWRRVSAAYRFLPQSFLPSTSLANLYLGKSLPGEWAALALWCAAAAAFGFVQFRRSFQFDFAAARTQALQLPERRETWTDRLYQLPGRWRRDPLAALVEKEMRYL
ncbi:MAG: hypothetical protein HY236_07450, partial [Acidobacteria bacterium]|nr:hypothetical protein [Acidobacteriota bacterium]